MENNLSKAQELNDLELDAVNGGRKQRDIQGTLYNNVLTGVTQARSVELARKYYHDYEAYLTGEQRVELEKAFHEVWHTEP